jgi:hypothetical protein
MSSHRVVSSRATGPARRAPRIQEIGQRFSDTELRASARRIVDMLQQLVLLRPEMIVPLEEIVRGVLSHVFHLEDEKRQQDRERRARGRAPLPAVPLSELPKLKALLAPPLSPADSVGLQHRAVRRTGKKKR